MSALRMLFLLRGPPHHQAELTIITASSAPLTPLSPPRNTFVAFPPVACSQRTVDFVFCISSFPLAPCCSADDDDVSLDDLMDCGSGSYFIVFRFQFLLFSLVSSARGEGKGRLCGTPLSLSTAPPISLH